MTQRAVLVAVAVVGAALTVSEPASADGGEGSPSSVDGGKTGANRPAPHERRNGAVLGLASGIAFGGSSGYPNDVKLLGNPSFYSKSPVLVGYAASVMVLGALSDYVSFGPVFTTASFDTPEWRSTGWGLGFRGEVFPLVELFPTLADTAIFAQAGFGRTELRAKGNYPSAEGSQSLLGLGVHHEFRLAELGGGHVALGPELEWSLVDASTASRSWVTAGARLVWYGGKVGLDRH